MLFFYSRAGRLYTITVHNNLASHPYERFLRFGGDCVATFGRNDKIDVPIHIYVVSGLGGFGERFRGR